MSAPRHLLEASARASDDGDGSALAVVMATEGSTYVRAGAMAMFAADDRQLGWLSGGCLELFAAVLQQVLEGGRLLGGDGCRRGGGQRRISGMGSVSLVQRPAGADEDGSCQSDNPCRSRQSLRANLAGSHPVPSRRR